MRGARLVFLTPLNSVLKYPRVNFTTVAKRHSSLFTIAIDGPAASGKSTTARKVAERLHFNYIDSGAIFRMATLAAIHASGHSDLRTLHVDQLRRHIEASTIVCRQVAGKQQCLVNGKDVSNEIRVNRDITNNLSHVAALPQIRDVISGKLRAFAQQGQQKGLVMDGRDIGTVVFPNADLKIFLTADASIRAKRRHQQLLKLDPTTTISFDVLLKEIMDRDAADINRKIAPLRQAEDAVVIDTGALSISQQVEIIVNLAQQKL